MLKIQKINQKIDNLESLFLISLNAYKKSQVLFKKEPDIVNIYFVYSRKEMNESVKKETPEWFVGGAGSDSIVIFSPSVFSKVSNHPESDFVPVLSHEIAHIFTKSNFKFRYPVWLYEGVAGYVAEQYKLRPLYKKNVQKFSLLHDQLNWQKNTNYQQAYLFTKYLFNRFGKEKCFELISNLDEIDDFKTFTQKFDLYLNSKFSEIKNGWFKSISKSEIQKSEIVN